jgi:AcrR family transcriptional regulator
MNAGKKRLSRQESQALTKEKLLVAAGKAFARRGFAGASIDEITEAAGFSRGAFHSNFQNKNAFFLALVERQINILTQEVHKVIDTSSSADEMLGNLRKFFVSYGSADKDAFLLITEAQLYAVRNPRFGNRLNALFRKVHDELIRSVEHFREQLRDKNPISAGQMVLIGFALGHGLALHNLMDPERCPDRMVTTSLELIFDQFTSTK